MYIYTKSSAISLENLHFKSVAVLRTRACWASRCSVLISRRRHPVLGEICGDRLFKVKYWDRKWESLHEKNVCSTIFRSQYVKFMVIHYKYL